MVSDSIVIVDDFLVVSDDSLGRLVLESNVLELYTVHSITTFILVCKYCTFGRCSVIRVDEVWTSCLKQLSDVAGEVDCAALILTCRTIIAESVLVCTNRVECYDLNILTEYFLYLFLAY